MGVLRRVAGLPSLLAPLVLFGLMVLTALDVLLRSIANAPVPAAPELTRIGLAVLVFCALPLVSAQGRHVTVDLADGWLPKPVTEHKEYVIMWLCGLMLIPVGMRCLELAEREQGYGTVSEYLAVSVWVFNSFVSVAVFITAAAFLWRGIVLAGDVWRKHPSP